ncbi:hypothetical protein [Devosia sp.]|uniref:PepSY domain-containing protein n=1 Tax=Devosia sp. TaxID=1871048 RepID=UPI0019FD1206|nr:hypothetical protein [Devosia sp.]MBE0579039.1 hypothetical protein [Devosia sp.]
MKRLSFAIVLVVLAILSQPVSAQGQGQGQGNGQSSGENGGGQGGGNGQGQDGNAGGGGNGQNGNAFGNDSGEGKANGPPSGATELSEDDALTAVESGRAVELATILPDVRARTGGEVINAQLQQVGAFLIYAVTVLTPSGQVLTEHYYASSGAHVER